MPLSQFIQYGYYLVLGALLVCVLWKGTGPMKRTILTILAVAAFSLTLAHVGLWPSPWYAIAMIGADVLALWVITRHPADKWQSVIGLTYVFQVTTWLAYLASMSFRGHANMDMVWWGLTIPALLQLFLVGGWFIGGRAARYWRRGADNSPVADPHRQGVAG